MKVHLHTIKAHFYTIEALRRGVHEQQPEEADALDNHPEEGDHPREDVAEGIL